MKLKWKMNEKDTVNHQYQTLEYSGNDLGYTLLCVADYEDPNGLEVIDSEGIRYIPESYTYWAADGSLMVYSWNRVNE